MAAGRRIGLPDRTSRRYVPVAFAAGAMLSTQSYVNGRLSGSLGSSVYTAALSTTVGFALLLAFVVGTGSAGAMRTTLLSRAVPLWQRLSGLLGGVLIGLSTHAAPIIGLVLLTLAMVCGQTLGGLVVDAAGIGPAGTVAIQPSRVIGCVLAIVAVGLGLLDGVAVTSWPLLVLMAAAGAGFAVQQAAMGHLARASHAAGVAAVAVFGMSGLLLVTVTAATVGAHPPGTWSHHAVEYIGGPLGATIALAMSVAVQHLGVLKLSLVVVAGQSTAGVVIDMLDPVRAGASPVLSVVGLVLLVIAVAITKKAPAT